MEKYWVWLSLAFSYGSDKPASLLSLFNSPKEIYNLSEDELKKLDFITQKDINAIKTTSLQRAENILEDCKNKKIRVICFDNEEYPNRLKNIYAPPMVLYVLGSIKGIDKKIAISVVGTRNATEYSLKTMKRVCDDLVKYDITLISGCAVGIDSVAHMSAVENKKPTIAVLGCGLDINYPAENRDLKISIIKNKGALISEFPPTTQVRGINFPIRNRIISALSCGVLVGQAPFRSGALITASYALEQGKEIFCIPPSDIYSTAYSGVNNLIRDGATCIFGAEDIILEYLRDFEYKLDLDEFLSQFKNKSTRVKSVVDGCYSKKKSKKRQENSKQKESKNTNNVKYLDNYSNDHKKVYHILTEKEQMIDEIVVKSNMPMAKVSMILLELELGGLIKSLAGGRYSIN